MEIKGSWTALQEYYPHSHIRVRDRFDRILYKVEGDNTVAKCYLPHEVEWVIDGQRPTHEEFIAYYTYGTVQVLDVSF